MKKSLLGVLLLISVSCVEAEKKLTAQEIVDKSIAVSGGDLFRTTSYSFDFRDRTYVYFNKEKRKILKRILKNDTTYLQDVLEGAKFQRFRNDTLAAVSDSLARVYGNSINSVHYFAKLPYGLNDAAVRKEYLGKVLIKDVLYYKIKITFQEQGGGDDFDDTYLYWMNTETFKVDYLAYEFLTNGGGIRFREAYNERYIDGLRFVDYNNYTPKNKNANIKQIDSLYLTNDLKLLSKIELKNIAILAPGSYN